MNNVLIIQQHSFVDLITNSSSEVFVCNTEKSLGFVREALLFTHGYKEPFIFPVEVSGEALPEELWANVKKYNDWRVGFRAGDDWWLERDKVNEQAALFFINQHPKAKEFLKEYKSEDFCSSRYWGEDTECKRFVRLVEDAISYGFNIPKNSIIIESEGDNSIPYEDWDKIRGMFNAKNYHLG